MKKALLAAVLLLHAATAGAATYWVSPTGSAGNSGADSTTNAKTLAWFNANAGAGDVCLFKTGTYTEPIDPTASGAQASRITYAGHLTAPGAVSVSSITLAGDNFVTVKGVTVRNGGLAMSGSCREDSLVSCVSTSGGLGTGYGRKNVIYKCSVTTSGYVWPFDGSNSTYPPAGTMSDSNTVRRCTIVAEVLNFRGSNWCVFDSNTVSLTLPPGIATDTHFGTYYFVTRLEWKDNHLDYTNNSGLTDRRMMSYRDSTMLCTSTRDTMIANNAGIRGLVTTSGAKNYVARIYWDRLYLKTTKDGIDFQKSGPNFRVTNSIIIAQDGPAISNRSAGMDSLWVIHNTLRSVGSPSLGVIYFDDLNVIPTNSRFRHNIISDDNNASGGYGIHLPGTAGLPSGNTFNYNLFFAPSGVSTRAVAYNGTPSAVGLGTSWNGLAAKPDSLSQWGSPRFADSTYSTFNATPGSGSFAVGGSWPDGYVGAVNPSLGDTNPPSTVTDLNFEDAGSNNVTLSWSAPDSSGTGSGSAASYDIRYSTSTITEGNWSSASQFTGEPTPQAYSGAEFWTSPSVLSPSTGYFVAMKSADEWGNISALSNVVSFTTDAGDVVRPYVISNLDTTSTGTYSATLTWTATGDDSLTGTAASYDIRYSTSNINDASTWAAASQFTGEPSPAAAGATETWTTPSVLAASTTYYISIRASDEAGNPSAIPTAKVIVTRPAESSETAVLDNFNRSDGSILDGTAHPWLFEGTPATISGNEATIATSPGDAYWDEVFASQQEVYATIKNTNWPTQFLLYLKTRGTNPDAHHMSVFINSGSSYEVEYYDGSYHSILGPVSRSFSSGEVFGGIMRANGMVVITVNGTAIDSVSGAAWSEYAADGRIGFGWWGSTTFKIDDFGGGTVTGFSADTTRPAVITDLAATAASSSSIRLDWTAPGDDGATGTATAYDIRYSTSTITDGNWSSATQATGEPPPAFGGTAQSTTISGLSSSTTYYFAIRTSDEIPNESASSNVASATTNVAATDGITLGQIEVYPNFNAAGVRLWYSGDDNQNSTAKMYLTAGASASTDTLDLAFDPDTLRNERVFAGSLFWLSEGTQYTVNVVVTDADGGSGSTSQTFTTRTVVPTNPTGTSYYVAAWGAGSDSAAGTAVAPFRTMQKAWSVMGPGDAMHLMAGAHRDTMTSVAADSGTVAAPKYIIGEAGSYVSGADPAYLVTSGWDSLTAAGQKLYFKTGFATYPRVVCFGDSMRLFRHKTANSIATDSLGTLGNLQYGWARSKTGDTLYVQLEGGASPNGYACNIASRTFGITIRANNVVLDGVGTRYFGTDWRTDYYGNVGIANGTVQLYNVKNVTIRNGYFLNNGWDAISSDSLYAGTPVRDITIERNIFRDTRVYGFDPATNFTIEHHPVVFSRGSRGTVVRYNVYRGFKDGGFRIDEIGRGVIGDVDFHNNDLRQFTSDSDAMEPDPCYCVNVRFWNNLVVDGGNAIDNESHRGPMYFIYNRFVRLQNAGAQFRSNYAFSDRPSESYYRGPTYYMHNTFSGLKSGASLWTAVGDTVKGVFAYNNIGQNTGDRPIDDATGAFTGFLDKSAWNYNFYVNSGSFLHKLAGANYAFSDTTAMRAATGYDANSKVATGIAFADTANLDFTPVPSNPAVQRGRLLRGINTAFGANRFSGAAPTMGAVDFDGIRPGPPTLTFAGRGLVSATVRWTAVGDDSLTDTASYYDLRISTSAINSGNFASATQLSGEPTPGAPGTVESYTATGLTKGTTYYFGLLVYDEVGNPSALTTTSGTTKSANAVRYKWYSPWTWIRSLFP